MFVFGKPEITSISLALTPGPADAAGTRCGRNNTQLQVVACELRNRLAADSREL